MRPGGGNRECKAECTPLRPPIWGASGPAGVADLAWPWKLNEGNSKTERIQLRTIASSRTQVGGRQERKQPPSQEIGPRSGRHAPRLDGLIHPRIGGICLIVAPGSLPNSTKPESPMSSFAPAVQHKGVRSAAPVVDVHHLASADSQPTSNTTVSLYRLPQVLARIPVSRSAWFAGIQTGRYPRSYSLGPRTTVWRSDDIDQLIGAVCIEAARPCL